MGKCLRIMGKYLPIMGKYLPIMGKYLPIMGKYLPIGKSVIYRLPTIYLFCFQHPVFFRLSLI